MTKSSELPRLISEAQVRIAPHVRNTFLERCPVYSQMIGANVFFKYENLQYTGSFKLRGAMNKLLALSTNQRTRGVVAASTGNHGKAVGHAANVLGLPAKVFVPQNADPAKVEAIKRMGAEVILAGDDCVEAEIAARDFCRDRNATYVSPYNDALVVAGQGVLGLELCDALDSIDAVFVSLGGGGLISGLGAAVKSVFPDCKIVGCSPENSKVMIASLAAGRILDLPSRDTLSDGTAGGIEPDAITFDYCQRLVDQLTTVSEDEIRMALRQFIGVNQMLIEGAAAVAVASLLSNAESFQGKNVVVVLCGANIGLEKLLHVLN